MKIEGQTATISGNFAGGFVPRSGRNIAFKQKVEGDARLAERISRVEIWNGSTPVGLKRLMAGEYLAEGDFTRFAYRTDLTPPQNTAAMAHSSWLLADSGVLMLDDLLPQFGRQTSAVVTLRAPAGWTARYEGKSGERFEIEDIADGVIAAGSGLRMRPILSKKAKAELIVSGKWHFTDEEAAQMAAEIFDEYSRLIGDLPDRRYTITIARSPATQPTGMWQAETRGRSVLIVSSDMPFRTRSLQRLHEQLRHEIFHLWFPNGAALTGDYAWFYEGAALYLSLKLGVRLNQIRFDDFLDTLSRAHTIDANSTPRKPLVGDRAADPTIRYARGMIVAFLADVRMLQESKGKADINAAVGKMFERYRKGMAAADGTGAAVDLIGPGPITESYVFGTAPVEWSEQIRAAGIGSRTEGRTTVLSVASKLNGRQRAILDRLGYNNWRKVGIKQ